MNLTKSSELKPNGVPVHCYVKASAEVKLAGKPSNLHDAICFISITPLWVNPLKDEQNAFQ
jgi:hypothetical protein